MNLVEIANNYYRTTLSILGFIIISGAIVFNNIPKESSPDVNLPYIYVSLNLTGISPEDSEKLLVKPIEEEIKNIEGKKELKSTSYQNGGNVLLEFESGFNADQALLDTRDKVDRVKSDLPDDADEPTVTEVNISLFPILVVSIGGDVSDFLLKKISNDIKDKINSLPNVLEVNIGGEREEQLEILIDQNKIESYGLNLNEILNFVKGNNQIVSAGSIDTGDGRFVIKIPGLYENLNDVFETPIKISDKKTIKFKDIAKLKRKFKDPESFARVNGQASFTLEISKRIGANIVDTVNQVKDIVEEEKLKLPSNINITYSGDDSVNIKGMLNDLQNNVIFSILLVMSVVILFLGVRSSLLVGLAVPGSFLLAVLVLNSLNYTVNMVVLFGLILSVGLLVDGAVVVVEYAQRKIQEGYSISKAYLRASSRMSMPIIASTLTTIAVFIPLLFWPGTTGGFMKYIPITLVAVLSSSLLMALVVIPTVGSQSLKIKNLFFYAIIPLILIVSLCLFSFSFIDIFLVNFIYSLIGKIAIFLIISFFIYKIFRSNFFGLIKQKKITIKENLEEDDFVDLSKLKGFTNIYIKLLSFLTNHPLKIIILSVSILISIYLVYSKFGNGVNFFPRVDADNSKIVIYARGNLSIDEKDILVRDVEDKILKIQKTNNEFKSIYTTSGNVSNRQETSEDVIGFIDIEFKDWDKRRKANLIIDEIREATKDMPGIKVETRTLRAGPPGGKPIEINLSSDNLELLPKEMTKIKTYLSKLQNIKDLEDSSPSPSIEYQLYVDREEAAKYGANISIIGNTIKLLTSGLKLSEFRPNDSNESIPIYLRLPEGQRTIDQLDGIKIPTSSGYVPISNFTSIKTSQKTSNIVRINSKRTETVKADVSRFYMTDAYVRLVKHWLGLEKFNIPNKFNLEIPEFGSANISPAVNVEFKGEDESQKESQAFLQKAFAVAIFMMAIILLTQFNSFYSVLLILFAVIMSTVGVVLGLMITGRPFGIVMSGIGVISLAGIVVNNNIVLIDTFDRLKNKTSTVKEAVLMTGAQRLRPVLLTTATTVLGLLPMVLKFNIDFIEMDYSYDSPSTQWWVDLSSAIVFGLLFSTFLTLLVTPCALIAGSRLFGIFSSNKNKKSK
ncbi:MAG: MFS transporter [Pelagibacteraceae bacterium]|mgnify:CR=1 FL=1|nr:MFS transporter [Pelagibacteraceae bacterium]